MRTTVSIQNVRHDIELVFDDNEFDMHSLKSKLYQVIANNNSEEMAASRGGYTSLNLITMAIGEGRFSEREKNMLALCIDQMRSEASRTLSLLDMYLKDE